MNRQLFPIAALAALLLLQPVAAQAYIGPGVGAGAVAAVLGVLGSIFLAIVAVLYYPIKRMMKGRKPKSSGAASDKPAE
jgi:hypothetical protein